MQINICIAARRRPDHPDGHLQQSVLLHPFDFGYLKVSPLCKWTFAKERRRLDHPDDHLQEATDDHCCCCCCLKKENRLLEEKIDGDTDRPTDQQGEYRAICLFESLKIEKRQGFAISCWLY